jgi:hypothetical protein
VATRALPLLGAAALLVWLLGAAHWISLSASASWVAFGAGVGLLAARAAAYRLL